MALGRLRGVTAFTLAFLSLTAWAYAGPMVYVRNVRVPGPCIQTSEEIYVPRESLVRLFNDALDNVTIDAAGAVVINGAPTNLKTIIRDRQAFFPLLALARHLKWEVVQRHGLGIIDVVSPAHIRLARLARDAVPVDPGEEAGAKRLVRKAIDMYGGVYEDARQQPRVDRIGMQIAVSAGRHGTRWQFIMLGSHTVNAMSVGGGRVLITRGLLELMDDHELAGAIAHEVAHDTLRHSARAADVANTANFYLQRAREARERQRAIIAQGGDVSSLSYMAAVQEEKENLEKASRGAERLQNWRTQDSWDIEREADRMGMIYAYNAGFNPLAIMHCLEKLAKMPERLPSAVQKVEGASDHPPLAERIELTGKVYDSYFRNRKPIETPPQM